MKPKTKLACLREIERLLSEVLNGIALLQEKHLAPSAYTLFAEWSYFAALADALDKEIQEQEEKAELAVSSS